MKDDVMKDSDITAIKIGSAAFTRKWWEERRSIFAHGSGTGKALDLWQKHCILKPSQMTTDQRMAAEETCNTLRNSLMVAKKKVGIKDKATVKACDAYIKLIDDFANLLNQEGQKSGALFDAEQELVDQLLNFIPNLKDAALKCRQIEILFERKDAIYKKWWQESASTDMGSEIAEQRKKQIVAEELEISQEMKKFTKLNADVINPWKQIKTQIAVRKVEGSSKIKKALRKANSEYDIYVEALGNAQDLGQDHLHLLKKLIDLYNGKQESIEEVVKAIEKLKEQLSDSTAGCGSKIFQQLEAISEIGMALVPLTQTLKSKTAPSGPGLRPVDKLNTQIDPEIREAVLDLETKTRQTDAIAQANMRAMLRLKFSVAGYAKSHGKVPECTNLLTDLLKGVKKAEEDFNKHQLTLRAVLQTIEKFK